MAKNKDMENKDVKPASGGNEFGEYTVIDETVIIYRSWFECLREQGPKRFAMAMIALLCFAFYGFSLKSFHLPRPLEAILNTFTPIIEANRKKRKGGSKGADYGKKGGRPSHTADSKTPQGLSDKTPMVTDEESPKTSPYNVNGNVKVNENDTVSVTVPDKCIAPHKNFEFYLPIFFFRNVRHPERQAKKFVEHYAPTDWRLQGGEQMSTDQQRIALARRWEIRDDTCDRFKDEDLEMWEKLFALAPAHIQSMMIAPAIKFQRTKEEAIIYGPKLIYDWIEDNLSVAKPIMKKWLENRKYVFVSTENVTIT